MNENIQKIIRNILRDILVELTDEFDQNFEANNEALEVIVAVGKKMISVDRDQILDRKFHKCFRRKIEQ